MSSADDAPAQSAPISPTGLLQLQGAFDSAGIDDFSDPRLDLFLVDHHTPPHRLRRLLAAAWDIDPDTTLKLVCHLRRRTGSACAEEEGLAFYTAAAWMHRNHPRTLAGNLPAFAGLGLAQDFPGLLHRLVVDAEAEQAEDIIGRKRARSQDGEGDQESEVSSQHQQTEARAAVALHMLSNDAAYRSLHDSVAAFFATSIKQLTTNILDSPFDQTTLLCDAIACRLFPSDSDKHQRRQRLRDQVLLQLQQSALMQQQSRPEKKSATSRLPLPHQIAQHLGREQKNAGKKQGAFMQWGAMVEDMRSKGSLANCLAVCDISMGALGPARKVAVAMALLISQLSVDPWTDWVHAFDRNCTPHLLAGRSYQEKVEYIRKMDCHDKFNLRNVFDRILFMVRSLKQKNPSLKVEPVKTIFVFTQRDFDEALVPAFKNKRPQDFDPAAVRPWKDEYDNICDKFSKADFEVPQVVFWNLKGQRSPALTFTSDGVMRLSGYSDDLMMLFLEKNGVVEPEDELYHAIAGEEYQKLEVHD
ncbi:unnamed protein product [Urochloa decumbens]|uniref:Uncharacterized protein n=1 Tax=Urochloa decumbens TaxID=240449 RepID=A0ABC9GZF4_9POAL